MRRSASVVRNAVGEIDRRGLEIGGDARLADALGDRGALALENAAGVIGVERRAIGVGQRDLDPFVALFQRHGDAGERAAGADRADEAVDAPLGLLPDLRAGGFVMAAAVGDVVELVGPDRAARFRFRKHFSESPRIPDVVVRVGVGRRGHFDQLGPDHPQHVFLFLRLGVGDDDHAAESERRGDHADADAGVAGRAFDDDPSGLQHPARHRVAHDREGGAVLDRAAGVHELGLAEDRAARRRRRGPQLDERRISDGFDDGRAERHAHLVAAGGHARRSRRREQAGASAAGGVALRYIGHDAAVILGCVRRRCGGGGPRCFSSLRRRCGSSPRRARC